MREELSRVGTAGISSSGIGRFGRLSNREVGSDLSPEGSGLHVLSFCVGEATTSSALLGPSLQLTQLQRKGGTVQPQDCS